MLTRYSPVKTNTEDGNSHRRQWKQRRSLQKQEAQGSLKSKDPTPKQLNIYIYILTFALDLGKTSCFQSADAAFSVILMVELSLMLQMENGSVQLPKGV